MIPAIEVARYFLSLTGEESDELISNLKLQKLLYYAQGFHLVLFNEPLFPESIEAWAHGPVVPEVYRYFRDFGGDYIEPEYFDMEMFNKEEQEFLNEIYSMFGQYSAWKLREMTHEESPWKDAYQPDTPHITICHEALVNHFKDFVQEE